MKQLKILLLVLVSVTIFQCSDADEDNLTVIDIEGLYKSINNQS